MVTAATCKNKQHEIYRARRTIQKQKVPCQNQKFKNIKHMKNQHIYDLVQGSPYGDNCWLRVLSC